MAYKFSKMPDDPSLSQLFREAEDNLATQSDLENKLSRTTGFLRHEPRLKELKDGDEIAYYDGTNYWLYRRMDGKLFRTQINLL